MALTIASRGAATRVCPPEYAAPPGLADVVLLPDQGLTPLAIACRRSAASKSTDHKAAGLASILRQLLIRRSVVYNMCRVTESISREQKRPPFRARS